MANYQRFGYIKQLYEIRVEIRQYHSETTSKTLISIWGSSSIGCTAQITATAFGAEPGCGGSKAPVPGSTLWPSSLSCHCVSPHTLCSRTHRSPPLKHMFYSWLAKENNFTKPEFAGQEEPFPMCSRILWPPAGHSLTKPSHSQPHWGYLNSLTKHMGQHCGAACT